MRKYKLFFLAFLLMINAVNHFPQKTKGNQVKQNGWTGRISIEQRLSGEFVTSVNVVTVNFSEAIPTLDRDNPENPELNFTDDKGTGTVTFHGEITLAGKKYNSDCSNSGQSELHEVSIDEENKTYNIQAEGPPCKRTIVAADGSTSIQEDITTISIPERPLTDPNVLARNPDK